MKKQISATQKLCIKEVLFNLRHSSLQNAFKHIFRMIKRHFQIFNSLFEYTLKIQVQLVFAVLALHNFIWQSANSANLYNLEQQHAEQAERQISNSGNDDENGEERIQTATNNSNGNGKKINAFCKRKTQEMWQNY